MLEKSFGLLFFLKKSNSSVGERRNLYCRITVDGSAKEFSTKRVWYKNRWEQRMSRAIGNNEDARSLNNFIDVITSKVYEAKRSLVDLGEDITSEKIYNIIFGNTEDRKMILEIFKQHNQKMKSLVGIDYAEGTIERYETSYRHTQEFIKWKYHKEDLELRKLNYEFICEYDYWLKTVRKCAQNTSSKYLANFKKIVLHCVKSGWLPKDPFYGFKLVKKEVERQTLTQDELETLMTKNLHNDRLNHVRDIFVFACYTGLAYIDCRQLRKDEIVTGIDGEQWISTRRQKTNAASKVPLLSPAFDIIQKYEGITSDFALPLLSNQKMNAYLKEIADLCGINKDLTFHIARHTFATTVTLANGVPIETVSKMLGHKSLRQTQHYAKIVDRKISEDMQQLRNKLNQSTIRAIS